MLEFFVLMVNFLPYVFIGKYLAYINKNLSKYDLEITSDISIYIYIYVSNNRNHRNSLNKQSYNAIVSCFALGINIRMNNK